MDDPKEPSPDVLYCQQIREVSETYLRCEAQRVAGNTIVSDVLRCDFVWTTSVEHVTAHRKVKPRDIGIWSDFVRALSEQIFVYGFAVYRLGMIKTSPTHDLRAGKRPKLDKGYRKRPEVMDGAVITVRWSDEERGLVYLNDSGSRITRDDGWRIIEPNKPEKKGHTNVVLLKSPAMAACRISKIRANMYDNISVRDNKNTSIHLVTQTDKALGPGGASNTVEWFRSLKQGSAGLATQPGDVYQPLDTLIADRLDTIVGLHKMSDIVRERTADVVGSMGQKKTPPPAQPEHTEHYVTDGKVGKELTYRKAPEDVIRLMEEMFIMILLLYTVMPNVLSKNMNSERMAGSNRMSEAAIERYRLFIRQFSEWIQLAVRDVSSEMTGDENTYVWLKPCISADTLRNVEAIVEPETLRELYECVYRIPKEEFNMEQLKLHQMGMLQKPEPASKDRDPLTKDQKDANMKAKAQSGAT